MFRRLFLLLFLLSCVAAGAQVQSLGDISFAVPPGWEYEGVSSGRAIMAVKAGNDALVIAVFSPQPSSGNADADFQRFWQSSIKSASVPEPIYEHKSLVGYPGRYGSTTTGDGSRYVHVYVVQGGRLAVPVMIATPNRQTFNQIEHDVLMLVESVRVAPPKAEAPKSNISVADLAGEWTTGADSSVNYVTASGAYAGSSTVAHSATYVISGNGSYTSQFAGVSNRTVLRGNSSGTVELAGSDVIFRERGGRASRYHFIAYQTAVNGATVLTLLDAQYEPTAASIGAYAEKWVRQPRR